MGWPEYTLLVIYTLSLGIVLARHGQPRKEKYNFTTTVIEAAIMLSLLYWGGFFE